MILSSRSWLYALMPARAAVSGKERLRGSVGAFVGIALTGFVSAFLLRSPVTALWLMAPMGASAVLLFGVPSSPLAQPWSIIGGNLVAALIGVTCAKLIADPVWAAAAAILFAVAAMFVLHCLHPPSGAVALTAVLGGAEIHAAGYGFVIAPVALNSVLLLFAAVAYNNATGRRYPSRQQQQTPPRHPHQSRNALPAEQLGFTSSDLRAALKRYDQVLDVSVDDLASLFRQTEMLAFRRRFGDTLCGDLMQADVCTVEFATPLDDAWTLMQSRAVQVLPVLDRAHHVIGIVSRTDFLAQVDVVDHRGIGGRLRSFLRRNPNSHSDRHEVAGQIMSAPVRTAFADTPAVELVPLMAELGLQHIPVVDAQRRLVGMVSQTDLVGALYEICLRQSTAAEPAVV